MISSAQISAYPLRLEHLGPTIDSVRRALEVRGLRAEVGTVSTMVTGEAAVVFAALADAFDGAAQTDEVVMAFTVSNACPLGHMGQSLRATTPDRHRFLSAPAIRVGLKGAPWRGHSAVLDCEGPPICKPRDLSFHGECDAFSLTRHANRS